MVKKWTGVNKMVISTILKKRHFFICLIPSDLVHLSPLSGNHQCLRQPLSGSGYYTIRTMFRKTVRLSTHGEGQIINISPQVEEAVRESTLDSGLVNIFVTGSTAAITTIEYEEGVLADFLRALNVFAPDDAEYGHNTRWGDGNGRSHVRASVLGPSVTIPFSNGVLMCGTWQQVVLVELDVRPSRERTCVITVTGDAN